jgi:hypothetical protein
MEEFKKDNITWSKELTDKTIQQIRKQKRGNNNHKQIEKFQKRKKQSNKQTIQKTIKKREKERKKRIKQEINKQKDRTYHRQTRD